ncbi:hypothetical protein bpuCAU1_001422 (plasmid) [Borrelia puertoricensis]|uniref:hypothetical protein n=1 Tax=Borrelia puertoricensis TaxID=2756107 RepID=UPI003EBE3F71
MKKINEIKLYKIGEAVELLQTDFNYKIDLSTISRKIGFLNAYVVCNNIRYIPEDILPDLTVNLRKKETRLNTIKTIEKKINSTKNKLNNYFQNNEIDNQKKINNGKITNIDTNAIISEIRQLKQEIQEDMKNKNREILQLKKEIQNLTGQTQEDTKNKNKEILQLKKEIQNLIKEKDIQNNYCNTNNKKNT